MRILIVDDDEFSLAMTQNALVEDGHEVETACNGREALELLHQRPCRMVISDWMMPELNGIELCREIRDGNFGNYVYIILLTAKDRMQDIVAGLSAGADDFITKPFEPAELRVRIRAGERVLALETRDVAIFAMARLAESRDPETGAHLERIRNYCKALARDMSRQEKFESLVNDDYVQMIYLTSPLHDIGKIGIPDSVLLKPGRLTAQEFEIMKEHTTIGAETLDDAIQQYSNAGFLKMARDIALTHHEKYDGSGYPRGLRGEQIPLCGRIVAVADVYDALRSKRVYKDAFSHHVARDMILEGRAAHFDPDVVDAFLRIEQTFIEIHTHYAEAVAALV